MVTSGDGRLASAPRPRVRTATLLCAAVALVAAAVPASAQPGAAPAPTPKPGTVVVADCFDQAQVRPEEYLLACGDGNNRLVELRWDTWGQRTATATGTDMVNDCSPNCAAGRFHPYPVTVTLSKPQPWPERDHVRRFTMIRLVYPDNAPYPDAKKDVSYKLVY
ncbi:hypothetical protein [Streptomyces sp. NBC_00122]|uniref:hypothetical protein n=1 Tax=Streptomyces sp. NBC_00122 TaxID=2903623 RepID=UPI00324B69C0